MALSVDTGQPGNTKRNHRAASNQLGTQTPKEPTKEEERHEERTDRSKEAKCNAVDRWNLRDPSVRRRASSMLTKGPYGCNGN